MTATRQAWSEGAVGSLHGRTAVVTGAYSGVGLATAQLPAEHGLHVVLACRDKGKGSKPPGTQLTPPQATRSGTGRSTSPTWSLRAHWAASAVAARASGRTGGNCQQRHRRPGQDRFRGPPGRPQLPVVRQLRPVEAGEPHVRARTSPSRQGRESWPGRPPRRRLQLASRWQEARLGPRAPAQRSHPGPHPGTGRAAAPARRPDCALRCDRGRPDRRRVHRTWRTDPPEGRRRK